MNNKKGFTLTELLTVIAIIAIISLIAIPNIINIVNNSKKETVLSDAKKLISIAKLEVNSNRKFRTFMDAEKCSSENNSCIFYFDFLNRKGDIERDPDGWVYESASYVKYYKKDSRFVFCIYLRGANKVIGSPSSCIDEDELQSISRVVEIENNPAPADACYITLSKSEVKIYGAVEEIGVTPTSDTVQIDTNCPDSLSFTSSTHRANVTLSNNVLNISSKNRGTDVITVTASKNGYTSASADVTVRTAWCCYQVMAESSPCRSTTQKPTNPVIGSYYCRNVSGNIRKYQFACSQFGNGYTLACASSPVD